MENVLFSFRSFSLSLNCFECEMEKMGIRYTNGILNCDFCRVYATAHTKSLNTSNVFAWAHLHFRCKYKYWFCLIFQLHFNVFLVFSFFYRFDSIPFRSHCTIQHHHFNSFCSLLLLHIILPVRNRFLILFLLFVFIFMLNIFHVPLFTLRACMPLSLPEPVHVCVFISSLLSEYVMLIEGNIYLNYSILYFFLLLLPNIFSLKRAHNSNIHCFDFI